MENDELMNIIKEGINIYNEIKEWSIILDGYNLNENDKKYLSLYFGVLNSDNDINRIYNENNYNIPIRVNYECLSEEEYLKLYNKDFCYILDYFCDKSLQTYLEFLITKPIISKINIKYNIDSSTFFIGKNKTLLKK